MADDYLGQDVLLGGLAPSRVAYVIEYGDEEAFRQAVRMASARWGGEGEPIVQLMSSGFTQADKDVVALAQVEAYVPVRLTGEQEVLAGGELKLAAVAAGRLAQDPLSRHSYPLSSIASRESAVIAQLNGPLWQVAAAGDVAEQWVGTTELPSLVRPMDGVIGSVQGHWGTLISRTGSQLAPSETAFNDPLVLWFADEANSLPDCLAFWNFRALRHRSEGGASAWLLPATEITAWSGFGAQVASRLGIEGWRSVDAVLWSLEVSTERLHTLARGWGLVERPADLSVFGWLPPLYEQVGDDQRQLTYAVVSPTPSLTTAWDWARSTDFDAHLFKGPRETRVRFAAPVSLHGQARMLLRLGSRVFEGLPRVEEVAKLIHPAGRWRGQKIQIPIASAGEVNIAITLPTPYEALCAVLDTVADRWALSSKGRTADALPDEAGELTLEPGLFAVLTELMTPRAKELLKALERMAAGGAEPSEQQRLAWSWGGRTRRRYRAVSALPGSRELARAAAERLVAHGWAQRGFECSCERCGSDTFVLLDQVSAQAVCPGCDAPAAYTSGSEGPTVHYRLDTFIDQAVDQGIFPHLMAIAVLSEEDSRACLLPGVDVYFPGISKSQEADVLGIFRGELLAGEVKTSPGDFTAEQISHDVRVSSQLGAKYHLMAAVHPLSADSRALAEQACVEHGLTLLIRDNLKNQRDKKPAVSAGDRDSAWPPLAQGTTAARIKDGTRVSFPLRLTPRISQLAVAEQAKDPHLMFVLTLRTDNVQVDIHHAPDVSDSVDALLGITGSIDASSAGNP
ncbi:hypothetical protein [Streptomyces afghaniensis]|uniref:hypothetical protein n=1 Tax=Streptomyces afghaniensis TaxID=66865 RepID=UPI0027D8C7C5|nr:hypothetical protein [Streptomyces afghaniensis]